MIQKSAHLSWVEATSSELQNELNKIDFIQKTIAQIDKDFANFTNSHIGENIDLSGNISAEIIQHIKENLTKLERENPASIPQIIYLIDLPEEIFQSVYQNSSSINYDLAQCILMREAHKVWMRGRY
jgi:hypothetical protein